jgi:hypothetical protein
MVESIDDEEMINPDQVTDPRNSLHKISSEEGKIYNLTSPYSDFDIYLRDQKITLEAGKYFHAIESLRSKRETL